MAHSSVKTIRDLIYWEYAKLIAGSTVGDRKNYGFVMHAFKKLRDGQIHPSSILRENKMLVLGENECAYCGAVEGLEWEHIIPRVKIIIDTIDNQVLACRSCNAAKGGRSPYEYYGFEHRYDVPRIVLGKYLKLIYGVYDERGTLDTVPPNKQAGEKLTVFDLEI